MSSFDFIVVGAGASGAVLASRLAHTPAAPSVLLIEAGSTNAEAAHLSGAERFELAFAPDSKLNWHYKTAPQTHLSGQEIDYSRGRGLGGSTAINFCGWTIGPRDDYDEWASFVGDQKFGWKNVSRILRKIENLDPKLPDATMRDLLGAEAGTHSTTGNLDLTYGDAWLPDISDIYTAAQQSGHRINPDVNSGDPIGMGMGFVCIANGIRATSASAYLSRPPKDFTILTDSLVGRVLFDGKKAVGVETAAGIKLYARAEVIISGGSLNTPQILLLSGIGPADELSKFGIPLVHHAPAVGKNLQDHCFSATGLVLSKDLNLPVGPGKQSPTPMGWFKLSNVTSSPEFQELSERVQRHLSAPTVPAMEIAAYGPAALLDFTETDTETYFGAICLIMNPQSRGSVTLQSTDPRDKPIIDPQFLTHPFDRKVMIEGLRETMRILSAPIYTPRTVRTIGPASQSDEDIWNHIKSDLRSSWHMSGTACMGTDASQAVVDGAFRVYGVEGLRVVDLSVCPFVINAHTQSTAYVLGEIGAEVLEDEYKLGEATNSDSASRSNKDNL